MMSGALASPGSSSLINHNIAKYTPNTLNHISKNILSWPKKTDIQMLNFKSSRS